MRHKSITVTSARELKKAVNGHYHEIIMSGELAKKFKKLNNKQKFKKASTAAGIVGLTVASLISIPATGGGSAPIAGMLLTNSVASCTAITATETLSIPLAAIGISASVFGGITILSMLRDNYTYVELGPSKVVFTRKR